MPLPSAPLPRITVVGESEEFVGLIGEAFTGQFEVVAASEDSVDGIADTSPALLMVGLRPDADPGTGPDLVALLREHPVLCAVPLIGLTTEMSPDDGEGHRFDPRLGIHLLAEPFGLDALEQLVRSLTASVTRRDLSRA